MAVRKIAVGTTSEQKISYLEEVLALIGIDAEILPAAVESGVSEQPMTSEETKVGSINRSRRALECVSDADMAIGVEVGYQPREESGHDILCWATITDKEGNTVSQESQRFQLPRFHQKVLDDGQYLGEHVDEYFDAGDDPVTQYVARILKGRKPFITQAIEQALIFYFHGKEF
jgi:non-canonical (house-cleaning) NTP pyrophosphatase